MVIHRFGHSGFLANFEFFLYVEKSGAAVPPVFSEFIFTPEMPKTPEGEIHDGSELSAGGFPFDFVPGSLPLHLLWRTFGREAS